MPSLIFYKISIFWRYKINEEDIADIIAHYFLLSEQIKSVVALGVKLDENGEVKRAGGYLIQLLPGVEDGFINNWKINYSRLGRLLNFWKVE